MASPIHEGTWTTRPFISRFVDIVNETILIKPDKTFETAQFTIEYHIHAKKSGIQIPLLFYASEFKEKFKIWIDNKAIQLNEVPEAYKKLVGTPFKDFSYFFETKEWSDSKEVLIMESPSSGFFVSIDDLKFFEADITAGKHIIRVEYVAEKWIDRSDWVKEYSFRYALSPAQYWKSFGNLEVTLDASLFEGTLSTNLGKPKKGNLGSKSIWTFTSIPTEILNISYIPEISPTAKNLLAITPIGITLIIAFILLISHVIILRISRKRKPKTRFTWALIVGSILIPYFILLGYTYSFDLIDAAIGKEASQYHGYTFLVFILYPLLLPVYWVIVWLADKGIKKRITSY
jgi:hypothetical protein